MKLRDHWILHRWLSAYLDGELTGNRLERVRRHVTLCQTCQRDLEEIRAGRDLLLRSESLPRPAPVTRKASWFPRPAASWAGIAVLAATVIVALTGLDSWNALAGWWRPSSVHAMDINFYAAQFRRADYCVPPCASLAETTLAELRSSPPFAVQYPGWLPEGMVLRRVIRYRTPRHEGVGLVFADHGKEFCLFQQPRKLGVTTSGRRTSESMICGRICTRIDSGRVQLFNWIKGGFCFVVAANLEKGEIEAVVASLRDLSQ